jgi:hypothetical protein
MRSRVEGEDWTDSRTWLDCGEEMKVSDITDPRLLISYAINRRRRSRWIFGKQVRGRLHVGPFADDHAHGCTETALAKTALLGDLLDQVVIAALEVNDPADVFWGRGGRFRHRQTPFISGWRLMVIGYGGDDCFTHLLTNHQCTPIIYRTHVLVNNTFGLAKKAITKKRRSEEKIGGGWISPLRGFSV